MIERFFGTLTYEHLYRAPIDDGGALAMETARFRDIHNRIRPHQALGDRTTRDAYLGLTGKASGYGTVTESQHRAGLAGPCGIRALLHALLGPAILGSSWEAGPHTHSNLARSFLASVFDSSAVDG